MKLETYQITVDRYLAHHGYAVIQDDGDSKLIQLKNLKLVWINSLDSHKYDLEEVTLGRDGERWENLDASTAIAQIQMLEGGNDTFYKIWHTDDVISLDPSLDRDSARLVLTMAVEQHDANIGINWDVLNEYINQLRKMKIAGII
jgi:hypothetical protein